MKEQNADIRRPKYPEIILKFREGGRLEEEDGRLVGDGEIITLNQFYETFNSIEKAEVRRSFQTDTNTLREMRARAIEKRGSFLPSLDLFARVCLPDEIDVDVEELVQRFAKDPEVNFVTLAGIPGPLPATPDLTSDQGYLLDGAAGGVGANIAWDYPGGDGTGIRVCVCERGFNPDHEDLGVSDPGDVVYLAADGDLAVDADHGTMTLGVLGAIPPSGVIAGVTGICHGADLKFASETGVNPASHRLDCIENALNALVAGDVLVLEMQADTGTELVPAEFDFDIRQRLIQEIDGNDKVVVAAAGNDDTDLSTVTGAIDTPSGVISGLHIWDPAQAPIQYDALGDYIGGEYEDSGTIIVGAGFSIYRTFPLPHSRWHPSNYGERVNCQGWGEDVATTGGGDLYTDDLDSNGVIDLNSVDINAAYTEQYNGTSSATAMVAGVVACLQGAVLAANGTRLLPGEVRDLLADPENGTPQVDSLYTVADFPIGPLPDLSRLIPAVVFAREPIDLELVMDVSDSMNAPSPSDPGGDAKLQMMRQAASIVAAFVNDHGQDDDRVGLVWFSDDAQEYQSGGQKLVPADHADLQTEISTHSTGTCTAMGAGLQTAFETLNDDGTNNPFVVLCTDGMQNIEPKAAEVGGHFEIRDSGGWLCGDHSSVPDHSGINIADHNTPVHIIGIGISAGYAGLLQDIANATNGFYIGTDAPNDDLDLAYLVTLCNVMAGGSPAIAHHSIGKLGVEKTKRSEYFQLNRSVKKITVLLTWKKSQQSALTFWLYAPDGTLVDLHQEIKYFGDYCLATLRLPKLKDGRPLPYVGQWRMVICGEMRESTTDYHAFVIVDDPEVKFRLDYQRKPYAVGNVLPLQIKIVERQKPIFRIRDLLLEKAYQAVPLAELFAQYEVSTYDLSRMVRMERVEYQQPPMLMKLEMMASDPDFQTQLKLKRDRLSWFKGHMECKVNKGEILMPIKLLQAGLHTFKVTVECETKNDGYVNRVDMISVIVEPGTIDQEKSEIADMEVSENGRQGVRITVVPRNQHGLLFGPGYGGEFEASMNRKPLKFGVDDLLDGTYQIEIMLSKKDRYDTSQKRRSVNLRFQGISVWKGTISHP